MWAIRFFNGKLAGQEIPLPEGRHVLGRSEECQIKITEQGVSKKHAELEVDKQGVTILDLHSSNGTFINGVKIQESEIRPKDKVSIYRTTFDIIELSKNQVAKIYSAVPVHPAYARNMPTHAMNPTEAQQVAHENQVAIEQANMKLTLKNWFKNYIDKVFLPGIYKLPVWLELKWVIACFLIFFVLMVTSLSAIPLIQILNSSVEQESMNHAESIATTLAQMNREVIQEKMFSAISVEYAQKRPGVTKTFIVSAIDGRILAPSEKAHSYSKIPFINEGRKKERTSVKKLDSKLVGAMVPIQFYNSRTNSQSAAAYAVVLYDIGTLAFGNKRTISLLIQTFFIASVLGFLIFFFLYKMIEFPIVSVGRQLDSALKDENLDVKTDYQFPPLQQLVNNINTALSRISVEQENSQNSAEYDRQTEMNQLIEMIGYPTLGVDMSSMRVEAVSAHFDETGVSAERIIHHLIEEIEDQALKLNLIGLIEKVTQHPYEIASDKLEFSGVEFQLSAKGIYGKDSLSYILISFVPMNEEEAA